MPATIFSGSEVKALKARFSLNDNAKILSGDDDPTSVAQDAPRGSLYLRTGASGGDHYRKLDDGSSTNWELVGSGGGSLNYIDRDGSHDAEVDVSGWVAYADAAGTVPVDGTGGSPTVTITRTTSTPLRGNGSFLLTKDAADRQGEGASFDFTIDDADKFKSLVVSFDYEVSASFASGDVGLFIYDVTNATLINPSNIDIEGITVEGRHRATFQATDSTSYRLILHVRTTNASAYTVKYDDVRVGPDNLVAVTSTSDWIPYTPTVGNLGSGSSTNTGFWRRSGDHLEVKVRIVKDGTPGSGGSGVTISIPSGLTYDSGKAAANNYVGVGTFTGATFGAAADVFVSGNNMLIRKQGAATNILGSDMTASSELNITQVSIPISGWASNFAFSEDGPNVVARYKISGSTANPALAASTDEVIDFDVKDIDTHNAVTTGASWAFTAPVDGNYSVHAIATIINENVVADDFFAIKVFKNASLFSHLAIDTMDATAVKSSAVAGSTIVPLNAGDTIDIRGIKNMSGNTPLDTDGTLCNVSIERIGSIISVDGNRQNRFQTKILSADVTSDGAISDLTFNNLRIGKVYRADLTAHTVANNGGVNNDVQIEVTHNSAVIARYRNRDANGSANELGNTVSVTFAATATSLTFVAVSAAALSPILGDGTQSETFAQLIEMNDTYQTTEF